MNRLVHLLLVILISVPCIAQVRLPRLISDGAVLQRETELKLWGWASAGEKITITHRGKVFNAQANQAGEWMIKLPPQPMGGPHEILVKGKNEIILKDIVFGDVWICSGQSNMELTMERVKEKYPVMIGQSENKFIRQYLVADKYDFKQAHNDLDAGNWIAANPNTVLDFSAVAYFFAKELYESYKVPIGLINASLGGSPIESWISEDALKPFNTQYQELQRFKDDKLIQEIEASDRERISNWYTELNRKDEGMTKWNKSDVDDSQWNKITLPGYWADGALGNINGVVWFRKKIQVPASMIGKAGKLWLGCIVDADSVFINGKFTGTTSYQYPPRRYSFSDNTLREGENTIAIRVINSSGRGGFVPDKKYYLSVGRDTINLAGEWKVKAGATMPSLAGQTFVRWKPTGLYNRMISPLLNYGIKGVIWYQGESNTGNPAEYEKLLPALISDWRTKWNQGDFPFLYVQLANFMQVKPEPTESNWAELRQAQLKTLSVPSTGMAVICDIGEWNDIHPLNKADVGKRLALSAKHVAYHEKALTYSGPIYQSHKVQGNKIAIQFTHVGSGLVAKGNSELKYFSIAGPDKKFVWAKARIEGNQVIVWSDSINQPAIVRYAWADNPDGANLYNHEGLPASPFTTENEND